MKKQMGKTVLCFARRVSKIQQEREGHFLSEHQTQLQQMSTLTADEHIDTAKKRQIPRTKADGPDLLIACINAFYFL
jgi:hypothetical protein